MREGEGESTVLLYGEERGGKRERDRRRVERVKRDNELHIY